MLVGDGERPLRRCVKRRLHRLFVLLALTALPDVLAAQVMVGVLEEAPLPADAARLATNIRVAFRKKLPGWEPICASKADPPWSSACKLPQAGDALEWTVLDAGRVVGRARTRGWLSNDWYAAEGVLRLTSPPPPRAGVRSMDYAGWPGQAVFRPLAATHGATPQGKSKWHEVAAGSADRTRVFEAFKGLAARIPACKPGGRSRPIRIADVDVIKVLASVDGRKLVGMHVHRKLAEECYERGGFASDAWFVLSRSGRVEVLPGRSDRGWPESTMPIEIGDFDSDGEEEALFRFSGYNEDGYLLFDRDFTRVKRFTWNYH